MALVRGCWKGRTERQQLTSAPGSGPGAGGAGRAPCSCCAGMVGRAWSDRVGGRAGGGRRGARCSWWTGGGDSARIGSGPGGDGPGASADGCAGLLLKYGGHMQAAGFAAPSEPRTRSRAPAGPGRAGRPWTGGAVADLALREGGPGLGPQTPCSPCAPSARATPPPPLSAQACRRWRPAWRAPAGATCGPASASGGRCRRRSGRTSAPRRQPACRGRAELSFSWTRSGTGTSRWSFDPDVRPTA